MEEISSCLENVTYSNYFVLSSEMMQQMKEPWRHKPEFKVTAITYCVSLLVGGLGNAAIVTSLIVISKRQSHASNNTSLFLASLTVADLLLLLVYVPLEVWRQVDTDSVTASVCKLTSYVEMLVALASVINLSAVSIERYIVIVHPLRSRSLCTLSNCRKALLAVWLISLILALPVIYTNDVYSMMYVENSTTCINSTNSIIIWKCTEDTALDEPPLVGSVVASYQMCMIFLFPAILMTSSYYKVMKTLWKSTKNMDFLTNMSKTSSMEPGSVSPSAESGISIIRQDQTNRPLPADFEPTRANVSSGLSIHSKVLNSSVSNSEKVNQSRKQIIKMLLVIILIFIFCWCPRFLLNVVKWYSVLLPTRPDFLISTPFYYFSTCAKILPVIHAVLNPIIYSLMCRSVRQTMYSCISGEKKKKKKRGVSSHMRRSHAWNDHTFELQDACTPDIRATRSLRINTTYFRSRNNQETICMTGACLMRGRRT